MHERPGCSARLEERAVAATLPASHYDDDDDAWSAPTRWADRRPPRRLSPWADTLFAVLAHGAAC